jgi:hypothetical protein
MSDGSDLVDQLGKLASLRESGALSQEEFESAKARVLSTLPVELVTPGAGAAQQAKPATKGSPSADPSGSPSPEVGAEAARLVATPSAPPATVAPSSRACGRAGCTLRGVWTDDEVCQACRFPTRQGEDAQHAAQKRQLLSTTGGGLEPGELPTAYGLVVRDGQGSSHPDCSKVEACTVARSIGLPLREGESGTLTSGTEGIAFWADDGLSWRWPYERVESITIGAGGATKTGGVSSGLLSPTTGVVGPYFAGFLNKVSTRTVVHSLINVVLRDSSVMFRTASVSQQKLELDLAPALRRLAVRG